MVKRSESIARDARVTYMESQLVRSLQKTSLDESRQSIIKYKGKSEDDYKLVLE